MQLTGSRKKKLCFVSSTLSKGGAERALSNLLCNMDRENLEITVLLLNQVVTYPVPDDVKLVDLQKRSAVYLPWCFLLLIKNLLQIKPDILISVWSFPSLLTGLALKLCRLKTSWVVRVANNPANQEDDWRKKIFYWLYQHATAYIVLCDELKDNFVDFYPYAAGKTYMIRNGFNIDVLVDKASDTSVETPANGSYLVSVGSLTQQKRYDILIEAYALLSPDKQIPLLILGDGPLRKELEQQAHGLGIADKIRFKGFVTNPYPYVSNAKAFVLNSDYEGLCNAAIEAQCLGVPAVITNCPTGNKEIVEHGVTGYLVATQSPSEMACGITALINLSENDYASMKTNATKLVGEKYRIERSVKSLNTLITDLN
ncbi:glycosyltransferase [Aliiglaciecola sp. LCG003]|uniref:glycosyltransferase n=1 Tax=Aliiglaciecola sp. LCG003 TaxID=3053655 RepID=UPI0025741296|nr:glycosyltransferase [Aliiglaciecola sp. LCG003]WJG10463.1 glycosyltransferase [Aliiglaciecola sp. LCG003]